MCIPIVHNYIHVIHNLLLMNHTLEFAEVNTCKYALLFDDHNTGKSLKMVAQSMWPLYWTFPIILESLTSFFVTKNIMQIFRKWTFKIFFWPLLIMRYYLILVCQTLIFLLSKNFFPHWYCPVKSKIKTLLQQRFKIDE